MPDGVLIVGVDIEFRKSCHCRGGSNLAFKFNAIGVPSTTGSDDVTWIAVPNRVEVDPTPILAEAQLADATWVRDFRKK
jgi:hypothetical protein